MAPAETGPPPLVLGTAGHIDHGKTTLIRALTGVDTDRLPEEKRRGITIDLGFAELELGEGLRAAVVDVPGHERLVRTMVAGATGIDLVLLVVAADEGVMPQTREHVAICRLLGATRGVVALTKLDVVDDETVELATLEIQELLAPTPLADAPVVPVSGATGAGLDVLRDALRGILASAAPHTRRSGPARLGIDRVFGMKGFGTVVTGTLTGGPLAVGAALERIPSGERVRVRGLQNHGRSQERVEPGHRCAVNLQGVLVSELSRGEVLTEPDALAPTQTFDAEITWLAAAPEATGPTSVELLASTSERRARVAPIGRDRLRPDTTGFARVHVDGPPLALLPGDRFVVRGFARDREGGATWGGGVVLDVVPPRRRRSHPGLAAELARLREGKPGLGLAARIERTGLGGCSEEALRRETGLRGPALESELEALVQTGVAATTGGLWIAVEPLARIERTLLVALDAYHAAEPLRPGMSTSTLRGQLPDNVPAEIGSFALRRLADAGELVIEQQLARRPDHAPVLNAETEALVERIAGEAAAAGLDPPSLRDWAESLGIDDNHLRDLLAHLERQQRLVRAPGDLWFDTHAVAALRERVRAHFESHDSLDTK
ncbi:MAG: selenocysteine-specific translation elongation factor, partial [Proteobacteria bacterium]|nr:selenocysteine-specific translation elongation factor [Pseudomonadota bacterium]